MPKPSKASRIRECQRILKAHDVGSQILGADLGFLTELLGEHRSAAIKIGPGLRGMVVARDAFGNRCFVAQRVDGTPATWSFYEALTPSDARKQALGAFRAEVFEQIAAFRDQVFSGGPVPCALCQLPQARGHVDHIVPFLHIAEDFLDDVGGMAWDDFPTRKTDKVGVYLLADADASAAWRAYHERVAVLRVLCESCNLGLPKPRPRK